MKSKVAKIYIDERGNRYSNADEVYDDLENALNRAKGIETVKPRRDAFRRPDGLTMAYFDADSKNESTPLKPSQLAKLNLSATEMGLESTEELKVDESKADPDAIDMAPLKTATNLDLTQEPETSLAATVALKAPVSSTAGNTQQFNYTSGQVENKEEYVQQQGGPAGSFDPNKYNNMMFGTPQYIGSPIGMKPDASVATTQFSLQMWLQQLLADNEALRSELEMPTQKKSHMKTMELVTSSHQLNTSGINHLISFAEELTEENMSMQRLLQSGINYASPSTHRDKTHSSSRNSKHSQRQDRLKQKDDSFDASMGGSYRQSVSHTAPDMSRKLSHLISSYAPEMNRTAPQTAVPTRPQSAVTSGRREAASTIASLMGLRPDGTLDPMRHIPSEYDPDPNSAGLTVNMTPLQGAALGYPDRPQSAVVSSKTRRRNAVSTLDDKNVSSGERPQSAPVERSEIYSSKPNQLSESLKHDKLEHRKKYARRMYSMQSVNK